MLNFSMNNVLSQVRSLQIITHMMILSVNYPNSSTVFFKFVFDYVSFDIFHPDLLYERTLDLENDDPFSEQADDIGYGSTFILVNQGSIPILLFVSMFSLLLYKVIIACTVEENGHWLRKWAIRKRDAYTWASFNDFYDEIYLTLCFSSGINVQSIEFSSWTTSVNSLFTIINVCAIVLGPLILVYKMRYY